MRSRIGSLSWTRILLLVLLDHVCFSNGESLHLNLTSPCCRCCYRAAFCSPLFVLPSRKPSAESVATKTTCISRAIVSSFIRNNLKVNVSQLGRKRRRCYVALTGLYVTSRHCLEITGPATLSRVALPLINHNEPVVLIF